MRRVILKSLTAAFLAVATIAPAATLYVDVNGTNPTSPFSTWDTAATNIQEAVNVATNGDTVLVTNGVYYAGSGAVVFGEPSAVGLTNGITLLSANGPTSTVIDGQGVRRGAILNHSQATLDGFTLMNGYAQVGGGVAMVSGVVDHCTVISNIADYAYGGGVYLQGGTRLANTLVAWNRATNSAVGASSVGGGVVMLGGEMTNCTVEKNIAYESGGGIAIVQGPPNSIVDNCRIEGNRTLRTNEYGAGGGGVYCGGGAILRNCLIISNAAPYSGGGLLMDRTNSVTACTIERNQSRYGGGISVGIFGGTSLVSESTISANMASVAGGGIYNNDLSKIRLVRSTICSNFSGDGGGVYGRDADQCTFFANEATNDGGGGYALGFSGCTFSNNIAGRNGGGAYILGSTNLMDCRAVGNAAGNAGGGFYLETFGGTHANCLVLGNTGGIGGGVYAYGKAILNFTISRNVAITGGGFYGDSGASSNLTSRFDNSIVFGNSAVVGSNYAGSVTASTYSCSAPLLLGGMNIDVDPSFADTIQGDYRVTAASPCIDVGGTGAVHDLDGIPRPLDGDNNGVPAYDMGAYEFIHPLADTDGDRMSDQDEVGAGTSLVDPASVFAMQSSSGDSTGWVVTWSSVSNKLYDLYHSTNLLEGFVRIATNVPATVPQNVFTDVTATADANYYQVRVGR